jgi:hypothetical protein
MKKIAILSIALFCACSVMYSQDDVETWERQSFITGYVSLEGEYINGVDDDLMEKNYGVGIGEAGFLLSVKPLRQFEFRSSVIYRPNCTLDNAITELFGEWKFSDKFGIKAGRFLTPLSPINQQIYAPMNIGVALPILVSHYSYFPNTFNGLSLNGKLGIGDNITLGYDVIAGGYYHTEHLPQGVLQFHGAECDYIAQEHEHEEEGHEEEGHEEEGHEEGHVELHMGAGGRLSLSIGETLSVGINSFYSGTETSGLVDSVTVESEASKLATGFDLSFKHSGLYINGAYWMSTVTPEEDALEIAKGSGYFTELGYTIDQLNLTPFGKYELNSYDADEPFSRVTFGLNYRPRYEITFKAEYHKYILDHGNADCFLVAVVFAL